MTDQQIKDQLARLKIFGNLDATQLDGYYKALRHLGHSQYVAAIDQLISTHEKHSFPLPSEILRNVREVVTNKGYVHDPSGDTAITGAFTGALAVIMNLENRNDFLRLNEKLRAINQAYGEATGAAKVREIEELNAIKTEAQSLPQRKSDSDRPRAIVRTQEREEILATADLPF